MRFPSVMLGLLLAVQPSSHAAEPKVTAEEMPRVPATEPKDVLKTFNVRDGFRLDLAAHEPEVIDPVTMCFDERGRLFVVEMIDYSERREENPHLGRIRMLEDVDGDGVYEKASIYAKALPWPTAVVAYGGGLYVGSTPDIWWLKDNDGDGEADERKVVFTGFAAGSSRLNVQALFNSFQFGMDNRIHGTASSAGGKVKRPGDPDSKAITLRRADFSFDPRTHEIRIETGGGQYGMSFDSEGRKFTCSNSSHAQAVMYDYHYQGLNPLFTMPGPRVGIAVDGAAAEVFRLSPDEPWRVIRTRWRISGVVRGAVEGGGRVSGYFTGATGITMFRGNAYPEGFVNNLFVGDAGGNLVHRKQVDENGVELSARRPDGEEKREFIASTDNWFRPVHFANGPDGCLYIADMYRETIEHPWSIPEEIKQHVDLNSGNDRGRIYRIAPKGFKYRRPQTFANATTVGLVAALGHDNAWQRETAARLLFERQDRRAIGALYDVVTNSQKPLTRLHALHVLDGLDGLKQGVVLRGLSDTDERVRVHAIKLAERLATGARPNTAIINRLASMGGDASVKVRFQLALSLALVQSPDRLSALAEILTRDATTKWTRAAALNAVRTDAAAMFTRYAGKTADQSTLAELARMIGVQGDREGSQAVIRFAVASSSESTSISLLTSLDAGLKRKRLDVSKMDTDGALQTLIESSRKIAADPRSPIGPRTAAIRMVAVLGYPGAKATLLPLLADKSVGTATLSALLKFSDSAAGSDLLARWKSFDATAQAQIVRSFVANNSRAVQLLKAIGAGRIEADSLAAQQVQALRASRSGSVRALAIKVLGEQQLQAVEKLMTRYKPALKIPGDAGKGKEIYTLRCATCHRANGEGHLLGPDMVTIKNTGREKLLLNIINPNAEVAPQYMAFNVDTEDDFSYTAVIANETPTHITLRMANGIEQTFIRSKVRGMKSSGKSLMPEELYKDLTAAQMADLLAFIEATN
jgi:putative membrane-bound dehydrogenase-like protein